MTNQSKQFLVPIILIGLAFILSVLDLFSSSSITVISCIMTIAITLIWRRYVLNNLSADFEERFGNATVDIRLSASRWSALIYVLTYSVSILACGLGYFRGGSWITFAFLILMIGIIAKVPWSAILTDWELNRVDTSSRNLQND